MSRLEACVIYPFKLLMNRSLILFFFILVALDFDVMYGQNDDSMLVYKLQYDSLYGTDPHLYNGIKYFPEYFFTRGFPFWKDDKPLMADIVFSGKYYKDLKIRYDLYTQEFILEYSDKFGGLQQIVMNRLKLDSIFIDDVLFIKNKFSDIKAYFLQVIHEDKISCYFTWKKEYRFNNSGIETGHEYSDEIVNSYLVLDGKSYVFANKVSFLKIFPADKRNLIRKFMKVNRIKVRRRLQTDMVKLCIYCNKLDTQ